MTGDGTIQITSALSEKAMIARLGTSSWGGRTTDKVATQELVEFKRADKDSASVSKALVHKDNFKRIKAALKDMKDYHKEVTLPWDNNGGRLLPSTKFNEYSAKIRECQRELDAAVGEFIEGYPDFIVEAEERLGDLFEPTDYPEQNELRDKFALSVEFDKVPEAGDFRVDMPQHEQDRIRQSIEGRVEAQYTESMKKIWYRIHSAVAHMHERLSDQDNIFHNTLVSNIEDLVNVLPDLNVMNDPGLDEMTNEIRNKLCGYNADDLRKDPTVREEAAENSGELKSKIEAISGFFEEVANTPGVDQTSQEDTTADSIEAIGGEEAA